MIADLRFIPRDQSVRTHRLHTPQALEPGRKIQLDATAAHYLGRVLRVSVGQPVLLFNGDGSDYLAEVANVGRKELELRVIERRDARPESPLQIRLVQAVSRGERMDETLQKCTELGVGGFQPLLSERVEVRLDAGKSEKRLAHWRAVVISACEQCGRAVVPAVDEALGLEAWLGQASRMPRAVLAPEAACRLVDLECAGGLELAVGPEGGFSETEIGLMHSRGVQAVRFGPRILRTETAGPAAVAALQTLFGDLGR